MICNGLSDLMLAYVSLLKTAHMILARVYRFKSGNPFYLQIHSNFFNRARRCRCFKLRIDHSCASE